MIAKQKAMLVEKHEASCPWRVRQAEGEQIDLMIWVGLTVLVASIYSMPIPSPSVLSTTLFQKARLLEPLLLDISIKHPLV